MLTVRSIDVQENADGPGGISVQLFDGSISQTGGEINIANASASAQVQLPPCILDTDGSVTYNLQAKHSIATATALVVGTISSVPHVTELLLLRIA